MVAMVLYSVLVSLFYSFDIDIYGCCPMRLGRGVDTSQLDLVLIGNLIADD